MNSEETSFERNLARLIQASCGPETRVTSSAGQQLRQQLLTECSHRTAQDEFPKVVLGILTGIILLLTAGGVWAGLGHNCLPVDYVVLSPFIVPVLLNFLCLPAAGLIVILHRRWRSCLND